MYKKKLGYIAIDNIEQPSSSNSPPQSIIDIAFTDSRRIEGAAEIRAETSNERAPELSSAVGCAPELGISNGRWHHIENLDQFFTRIYEYYIDGGFACKCLRYLFSLLQLALMIGFITFFPNCVDYDVLFKNKNVTADGRPIIGKTKISDVVKSNCLAELDYRFKIILALALFFWGICASRVAMQLCKFWEIHLFYKSILGINDSELSNYTWTDILSKLRSLQSKLHFIINQDRITVLDIYLRILRFKNYLVALVNQGVLPPYMSFPYSNRLPYFSTGLRKNLEWLLFWGFLSPWNSSHSLKEEYKDVSSLPALASRMEKAVTCMTLINLFAFPLILLYQVLYYFFSYAEIIKRDPSFFGTRCYSNFARCKLRHFNELDHELRSRLSKSYKAGSQYMEQFVSPLVAIFAKNFAIIAGVIFFVLFFLSAIDEDVITVEYVLTIMTICGFVIIVCKGLIPDENLVWQPEFFMENVLSHLHYAPDHWKGNAHKDSVRKEFGHLFRLKAQCIFEEVLSPLLTPYILFFHIRPKMREIVHFFHSYTDNIEGTGDVCSFSLMDVARHGDPHWNEKLWQTCNELALVVQSDTVDDGLKVCAKDGKTELSLLRFATLNPTWEPSESNAIFIRNFYHQVEKSLNEKKSSQPSADERQISQLNFKESVNLGNPYKSFVDSMKQSMMASEQLFLNQQMKSEKFSNTNAEMEMSLSIMHLRRFHDGQANAPNYGTIGERNTSAGHVRSSLLNLWDVPAQSAIAHGSRSEQFPVQYFSELRENEEDDSQSSTFANL